MKNVCLLIGLILSIKSYGQITPDQVRRVIMDELSTESPRLNNERSVAAFYESNNYQLAWMRGEDKSLQSELFHLLASADEYGMDENNYQYPFVQSLNTGWMPGSSLDTILADLRLTDAAIHFYKDNAYGNTVPILSYTGIKYRPDCGNIVASLAENAFGNKSGLPNFNSAAPIPEITAIQNKISWIVSVMSKNDFKEMRITSKKTDAENRPLCQKLYQLGFLDSVNENILENRVKQKIQEAQWMFNLAVSGELSQELIRELNVPLRVRLQQLNLSINYYRWLSCLAQKQQVIVVNIPSAYLKVYEGNKVILEMRMVVGKPSTPTFTLASTVTEVILYPYWYVPLSIAVKELLPAIKRDRSLLNNSNYQVLTKAGKIVDPYSVNWNALSRNYFPYIIRQSTGCDNSLGLLKLNFYNPFGAYLHDTPAKDLFKQRQRFYSHGCMRMEKPMELGHLVLKNNQVAIDTLTEKGCLKNQSPIIVPADVKMPVIVWYNPAGVDSSGRVLFFEDVYKKFNWGK